MAIDTTAPRTRRALLAGVGGAIAALGAHALGRPLPVAANGEAIQVGGRYVGATSRTNIRNQVNDEPVFSARSDGAGTALIGSSVAGSGVEGVSKHGNAIRGYSIRGVGVHGRSVRGIGVVASSTYDPALSVEGMLRVARCGGTVVIDAGRTTVSLDFVLNMFLRQSFVLLAPYGRLFGRELWYKTFGDTILEISISAPLRRDLRVAYLVIQHPG